MSERRGPGRPPLTEGQKSECVHVRLPAALLDDACLVAIRSNRTLSSIMREAISLLVEAERDGILSPENRNPRPPTAS